jgi:hypothetical protein
MGKSMQSCAALPLPQSLPHPKAIASTGATVEQYQPAQWEYEYRTRRYLSRVIQGDLERRHDEIRRNLMTLSHSDRDVIPITSSDSSWFWIRKEFQTRLEFSLRSIPLPDPQFVPHAPQAVPERGSYPNASDVLFRFGKKIHLLPMLTGGAVRLGSATSYVTMENDAARRDEETIKSAYLPGDHARVSHVDGREIPVVGDITRQFSTPNYYMLCLSSDWDNSTFDSFKDTDSCLVVRDTEKFGQRTLGACLKTYPESVGGLVPVHYFDPHEMRPREPRDPALMKDFRFAYQQEWRLICTPGLPSTEPAIFVNVGPLADIAALYNRDGEPIELEKEPRLP